MRLALALALALTALTACRTRPATPSPADFRRAVAGADWELVTLRDQPAPTGAGARRATLRFDADSARVSGFAGCNRFAGGYTLGEGAALSFGALAMTRMACADGMTLERQVAELFTQATRYELADGRLTLLDATRPVATFTRAAP